MPVAHVISAKGKQENINNLIFVIVAKCPIYKRWRGLLPPQLVAKTKKFNRGGWLQKKPKKAKKANL